MTNQRNSIRVDARAKSVRELLDKQKYSIDYYQREYRWEKKHIVELLNDLEARFTDAYEETHERKQVQHYPHYFMGSVVVSHRDGDLSIIDGQQRLTSLTLLLIYLHHLQRAEKIPEDNRVEVNTLIFSTSYGDKSFNMNVLERKVCMEALYNGEPYTPDHPQDSTQNILDRYQDIEEYFPKTLKGKTLPYFVDWLKENVDLVQITAYSDEEAYAVFETMNDRGLRLTPTEMLKGYLLANITDTNSRARASKLWQKHILALIELKKEEELDFFKNWLRAKYADSIRPRQRNAKNQDFENIATAYHKWVRDHAQDERLALHASADFTNFVLKDFDFFAQHYLRIRRAADTFTPGLDLVYYNAYANFTLQYMLLLAPLQVTDEPKTVTRKIRLVATYLDIFIARRIVNYRTLRYSSIVYTMFRLMQDIRGLEVQALADLLKTRLAEMEETFDTAEDYGFGVHQQNRRYVHYLLARITHHIEAQCGIETSFVRYISRDIKKPFEVEHIWANKFEYQQADFDTEADFHDYRDAFGALLLVPRGFNQSFGDKPYDKKIDAYFGQNMLAQTLHPNCYKNNPSFLTYVSNSGLPFKPYPDQFNYEAIDERQALYFALCREIWNPARLDTEAAR